MPSAFGMLTYLYMSSAAAAIGKTFPLRGKRFPLNGKHFPVLVLCPICHTTPLIHVDNVSLTLSAYHARARARARARGPQDTYRRPTLAIDMKGEFRGAERMQIIGEWDTTQARFSQGDTQKRLGLIRCYTSRAIRSTRSSSPASTHLMSGSQPPSGVQNLHLAWAGMSASVGSLTISQTLASWAGLINQCTQEQHT